MSETPVTVILEPPLPEIVVEVFPETQGASVDVTLSQVGLVGPPGPPGPPGPSGSPGGASYTHTQGAPAASWTLEHNLGRYQYPVIFLNGSDEPVLTDTIFPDANTIVLIFPEPVVGVAYI